MIYMKTCRVCRQGIESHDNKRWIHTRTGLSVCAPQGVATP